MRTDYADRTRIFQQERMRSAVAELPSEWVESAFSRLADHVPERTRTATNRRAARLSRLVALFLTRI